MRRYRRTWVLDACRGHYITLHYITLHYIKKWTPAEDITLHYNADMRQVETCRGHYSSGHRPKAKEGDRWGGEVLKHHWQDHPGVVLTIYQFDLLYHFCQIQPLVLAGSYCALKSSQFHSTLSPGGQICITIRFKIFLAVHNSSIGDLVTDSLTN